MRSIIFDRLSFLSLFLVITLLPFFFLPLANFPVEVSKGALLVVGLVCSLVFWSFARLFDGKMVIPKSFLLVSGGGIILVFFLSAIFSQNSQVSMFGNMFDIGSFWFIFSGFLLMFLSSIILGDPKVARVVLFGSILSGAVLLVFQIAHLFFPETLSLGILNLKTDNVLGSWNALGIFAGFSALMSLVVVEFFPTTRATKIILQALVLISMFMVAAVNLPFVWEIFGIFALIIFVYKISITSGGKVVMDTKIEKDQVHFPIFSFIVILLSLLFFVSPGFVGGFLPNKLQIQSAEVSPSFADTMFVAKSVTKESPLLGIGPNKFGIAWANHKPQSTNLGNFWDVPFVSGSGLLPTLASTTGILGMLALFIFIILFLVTGVQSVFSSIKNGVNWETIAFFLLSLYLFISSFFYSSGPVLFLIALAFAGVFAGLSVRNRKNGEVTLSFLNDHRKSFFSMLFIVLVIILSVTVSFKYVERLVAFSYFQKAVKATDVESSITSIEKALKLYQNDLYLRTYGEIYRIKLSSLASKGESLSKEDKNAMQPSLDQAVYGVQRAIAYNSKNYLNYQALGNLYQNLMLLGVKGVNSKAIEAYESASTLNPSNPRLKITLSALYFAEKQIDKAKEYANTALLLKPNYLDALIVLSQIATSEGDRALALSLAERALALYPNNAELVKYVGGLKAPSPSSSESTSNKNVKKP